MAQKSTGSTDNVQSSRWAVSACVWWQSITRATGCATQTYTACRLLCRHFKNYWDSQIQTLLVTRPGDQLQSFQASSLYAWSQPVACSRRPCCAANLALPRVRAAAVWQTFRGPRSCVAKCSGCYANASRASAKSRKRCCSHKSHKVAMGPTNVVSVRDAFQGQTVLVTGATGERISESFPPTISAACGHLHATFP